jgi:hypothetical protein
LKNFKSTLHDRKGLGIGLIVLKDKTEVPGYSPSMDCLPRIDNFRQSLRAAASCQQVGEGIQKLAWLAGHRLGFVEALQLDLAISECDSVGTEDFSAVILYQLGEPGNPEIDTRVMSCRVFGRELEFEIINIVAEAARQHGAGTLVAAYVPTARNLIIKNLYADPGFSPSEVAHPVDRAQTRWYLDLAGYKSRHTHILGEHIS